MILEQFDVIQRFIQKHGDRFDYSKVEYKNQYKPLTIICNEHHEEFLQSSKKHLIGIQKCKSCIDKIKKLSNDKIIQRFIQKHGDRFDYSKVNFINTRRPVIIICTEHGQFSQTTKEHLIRNETCPKCTSKKYKQETILEKFAYQHGNTYDYSKVVLTGSTDKIIIICKIHGEFEQSAHNHLSGSGCQQCGIIKSKGFSKQEIVLKLFVRSITFDIIENSKTIIHPQELDIYIPEHQIAIEYNGLYWHSDEKKSSTYHIDKTNKCKEKGIRLIHIFEDEWINKQQIVKSRLSNIFSKTTNRIWARKCIIKDVTSSEAKQFLELNHIQGHAPGRHKIGLYYEDELVALMTFCNLRKSVGSKHVDGSYELLRYCNKLDHTVIGGASRLLKNFIKTNKPQQIISYSDKRWSVGNMYKQLGFVHVHDSPPNYFYIIDGQRKHRYGYRKDLLVAAGYDKSMTEREIMQSRGINRIYDSGASKWLLTLLN